MIIYTCSIASTREDNVATREPPTNDASNSIICIVVDTEC